MDQSSSILAMKGTSRGSATIRSGTSATVLGILYCTLTLQGFVWETAPQFGAMVIFVEHRYYGNSLPFGNDSYKDATHLTYLTSEQALADFAVLATALRVRCITSH